MGKIIVEKGYVLPEHRKKVLRIEKKTIIYQKTVKTNMKKKNALDVLEDFKRCPTIKGKRTLWAKFLRLKRREEKIFTKDQTEELVKAIKKYGSKKGKGYSWMEGTVNGSKNE